jgi:hypothetical protein
MFNGELTSSKDIFLKIQSCLELKQHSEHLSILVTQLSKDSIVLGILWLKQHDVDIVWKAGII